MGTTAAHTHHSEEEQLGDGSLGGFFFGLPKLKLKIERKWFLGLEATKRESSPSFSSFSSEEEELGGLLMAAAESF